MRVVSEPLNGMDVTLQRTKEKHKSHVQLHLLMTQTVNHAESGDIIGLYDTGNYQIETHLEIIRNSISKIYLIYMKSFMKLVRKRYETKTFP